MSNPAPSFLTRWYMNSVSNMLRHVARHGDGRLCPNFIELLRTTGDRVFVHESQYNGMNQGVIPLNPDPMFTYNGYRNALDALIIAASQLFQGPHAKVYKQISRSLTGLLAVAHSKGSERLLLILSEEDIDSRWEAHLYDLGHAIMLIV
ncbi:hypothetical protein RhiXN_04725 [Rhizoctonia solani]|uniref:Uncharacterized protein n=1 Tax=Rhizoctonia solani TaxID=456999 RepID=A0A8H8SU43_9AGAM|nr:uncharacterized protein RhiXN_04725 [Rhizoctonia solani]QRW16723.1 hypothetical protein RhiXN_04725 [Rhizoctonia solani]